MEFTSAELIEFSNELSRELHAEKQALLALYEAGLIKVHTDVVMDGGPDEQGIPFAQAYGRLEGQEKFLNALAAFVMAKTDEKLGRIEPKQA